MKQSIFVMICSGFLFLVLSLCFFVSAQDEQVMTVEANIFAGAGEIETNETIVSIQVPNYMNFGNLAIGNKSEEIYVQINNTGNVNTTIILELNSSNDIYNNLNFRKRKTGKIQNTRRE